MTNHKWVPFLTTKRTDSEGRVTRFKDLGEIKEELAHPSDREMRGGDR